MSNAEELDPLREFALRVGAWGISPTGSPAKVGEYQDLSSSPFWDVDGLYERRLQDARFLRHRHR